MIDIKRDLVEKYDMQESEDGNFLILGCFDFIKYFTDRGFDRKVEPLFMLNVFTKENSIVLVRFSDLVSGICGTRPWCLLKFTEKKSIEV